MNSLDALFDRDAAPVQCWGGSVAELEGLLARAAQLPGTRVLDLDSEKLPDAASLFRALAGSLAFPAYFGANWDALDECLNDLEWLTETGILLAVRRASRLLEKEPEGLDTLLGILDAAARKLEEPQMGAVCLRRMPVQFRVLLQEEDKESLAKRLEACGHSLPEFRG